MFVITKRSSGLIVLALLAVAAAYLLVSLNAAVFTAGLCALSIALLSVPVWAEHGRRFDGLVRGLSVHGDQATLTLGDFQPLVMDRDELECVLVAALASAPRWWAVKAQRVSTAGTLRLALLTSGDTTVLNIKGDVGPGYRIVVPTSDLGHVLSALY